MKHRFLSAMLLALAAAAGCAGATDDACQVGADCASGLCNLDGTCGAAATTTSTGAGGEGGEGVGGDASSTTTTSSTTGAGGDGTGGSGTCQANHDGTITRDEAPYGPGLHATYRAATDAQIDTAGAMQGDGSRIWDLTGALTGDHAKIVETLPIEGQWFESVFPGASYASRLSESQDLLGVFEITGAALLLRGVVSSVGGTTRTELTYAPAVTVLAFPLNEGDSFSTTSTLSGLLSGVIWTQTETYDSSVDAHGTMKTPFADFDVLRIGVDLTRTVGFTVTTSRTYLFATECLGNVAKIISKDNELSSEFTQASEVERLAP